MSGEDSADVGEEGTDQQVIDLKTASVHRAKTHIKDDGYNETENDNPVIDQSQLETRPETDMGDGSKYVGQWKGSLREGKGKETLADGAVYDGAFYQDLKRGNGLFTWPDKKSYYDGEWRNNKF